MINATCVLITREDEYPEEILERLPKFSELIIETNCPSVYRRYELAKKAKCDVVYVQDDDCITDVEKLWGYYDGSPLNAITEHHKKFYEPLLMTLVGFGCFFPKDCLDFTPYTDVYGEDPLLLSQADRVFSYLNRPFTSKTDVEIYNLDTATGRDRMSTQKDHWTNLETIKQRLWTLSTQER